MTKTHVNDLQAEFLNMFIQKVEEKQKTKFIKKSMWSNAHPKVQECINENGGFQGDVSESVIADWLTAKTNTVFYQQKSFNNKTQIDVASENGLLISVKSARLQEIKKVKELRFTNLELDEHRPEQLVICIGILPTEFKIWTLDLDYLRANKDNKIIPGLQSSTNKGGHKKYTLVITQERKRTRRDFDMTWIDKHEGIEKMEETINHHSNLLKTDI